jgi:hypothetical protein
VLAEDSSDALTVEVDPLVRTGHAGSLSRTGTRTYRQPRARRLVRTTVSETLLAELERAVGYPKLRTRVAARQEAEFVALLCHGANLAAVPRAPPGAPPTPATINARAI